jgi:spermidine/putrescine transport system substrate-binding protein
MTPLFRILRIFAVALLALPILVSPGWTASRFAGQELVVLNWAAYLDPEIVAAFEQEYDVKVKLVYYQSDEARDKLVAETEGRGFDVLMIDGSTLTLYRKRGWVSSFDAAKIPNREHIDPGLCSTYTEVQGVGVPYFWGTIGIAYRTDLVPEGIDAWRDILDPPASAQGKIAMVNDSFEVVGAALKSLGHSINTSDREALAAAERMLLAQKPHVRSYNLIRTTEESALVTGDVVAAMIYNGDALVVQEHHPSIAFVHPEEGTMLWCDYMAVGAKSNHPDLAHAFIDFVNEPENAARNAEYVYYATPNRAAEKLLPKKFREDPHVYPPAHILRKSEFFGKLTPRGARKRVEIFSHLTVDGS